MTELRFKPRQSDFRPVGLTSDLYYSLSLSRWKMGKNNSAYFTGLLWGLNYCYVSPGVGWSFSDKWAVVESTFCKFSFQHDSQAGKSISIYFNKSEVKLSINRVPQYCILEKRNSLNVFTLNRTQEGSLWLRFHKQLLNRIYRLTAKLSCT